jgi:serine/threonine protein kinase
MSIASNTTLGNYKILSKIGAGGMGKVYRDTRLDREVAIKLLPAEVSSDSDRQQSATCRRIRCAAKKWIIVQTSFLSASL